MIGQTNQKTDTQTEITSIYIVINLDLPGGSWWHSVMRMSL